MQFVESYSQQLNSRTERGSRSLTESAARTLLIDSRLKVSFWPYTLQAAAYILSKVQYKLTPTKMFL